MLHKFYMTTTEKKNAFIKIPLDSLRCISRYPKEKKIVCEIKVVDLEKINNPKTLDEIINEGRLDYALEDYKAFSDPKSLVNELHS